MTDSAITTRYVQKVHRRYDHLVSIAKRINQLLLQYRIRIMVKLVKSEEISKADLLLRLRDKADWKLSWET